MNTVEEKRFSPLRARRWLAGPRAPFVLLGLALLACHLGFAVTGGDEEFYGAVLGSQNLFAFLAHQYAAWSGRSVIELVLCLVAAAPRLLWRVLNPAVILALGCCLSRLLGVWENARANRLLCLLLWLVPWWLLSTAGWVATTLNYLWPAAALAAALALLQNAEEEGRRSAGQAAAALLLGLYSANSEQTALLAILLLGSGLAARCFLRKPLPRLAAALLAEHALGLLLALSCPGNALRSQNEMVSYYKNFAMLSFWNKVDSGVSGALSEMFLARNLLYLAVFGLLALAVWARCRCFFARLLALEPFLLQLLLGVNGRRLAARFPQLEFFTLAVDGSGIIHVSNCNSPAAYLPLVLLYGSFAAVLVSVYCALGHTPRALAALVLLVSGLCTRTAIGFTTAAAVSGERTGFLLEICCLAVGIWLYDALRERKQLRWAFWAPALFFAAVQVISLGEI